MPPTDPPPQGPLENLPSPAREIAGEYESAIAALANALTGEVQLRYEVDARRAILAHREALVALSDRIDGKNEAQRRAQTVIATNDDEHCARTQAALREAERDLHACQAQIEIGRERVRFWRTALQAASGGTDGR